jgi:hypothetical protein
MGSVDRIATMAQPNVRLTVTRPTPVFNRPAALDMFEDVISITQHNIGPYVSSNSVRYFNLSINALGDNSHPVHIEFYFRAAGERWRSVGVRCRSGTRADTGYARGGSD